MGEQLRITCSQGGRQVALRVRMHGGSTKMLCVQMPDERISTTDATPERSCTTDKRRVRHHSIEPELVQWE